MKIGLASDHRGYQIKARLVQALTVSDDPRCEICDFGTATADAVDYPDYAVEVARRIQSGELDRGVLICGTGIGMAIVANKFMGVRAAACYDEVLVEMSRRHNNINVLCLPGDLIGERSVDDLVRMWLRTGFEHGRHDSRVNKIAEVERQQFAGSGSRSREALVGRP